LTESVRTDWPELADALDELVGCTTFSLDQIETAGNAAKMRFNFGEKGEPTDDMWRGVARAVAEAFGYREAAGVIGSLTAENEKLLTRAEHAESELARTREERDRFKLIADLAIDSWNRLARYPTEYESE
jgi:hypothetical protein